MGNKAQNNKTTPIIVLVSINEFADKLKDIRSICRKYKAIETLDNATNTILFYFHDNGLWLRAKQEIQLLVVGQINFKLSSKRVIIMEKMKDTIVEPPQPPTWFLEFQKWIVNKFEQIDAHFDRQEQFNSNVISRLDKIETDIKKIDNRLDRIIKFNNLKEWI